MTVKLSHLITACEALRANAHRQIFGRMRCGDGVCAYACLQDAFGHSVLEVNPMLVTAGEHWGCSIIDLNDTEKFTFYAIADWLWEVLVDEAEVDVPLPFGGYTLEVSGEQLLLHEHYREDELAR